MRVDCLGFCIQDKGLGFWIPRPVFLPIRSPEDPKEALPNNASKLLGEDAFIRTSALTKSVPGDMPVFRSPILVIS